MIQEKLNFTWKIDSYVIALTRQSLFNLSFQRVLAVTHDVTLLPPQYLRRAVCLVYR
jgi:hypothetical protein